ncbi:hypothetical protein HRbin03_00268 [archaeon HR03]|nr:hypothetical protein HGMM_F11H10C26 [Candidatus Caldarchaeum subterraneum]GBC72439.1 hypothetical protein HRbin03_00268 [archaeon HR03]
MLIRIVLPLPFRELSGERPRPFAGEQFKTGNKEFDEIVKFTGGAAVLVLDESFAEGRNFIQTLFAKKPIMEIISPRGSSESRNVLHVEVDNLQSLSIQVNTVRKTHQPMILLHLYLPDILVKHGEENVLRMINFWLDEIRRNGHLEFFIIPKHTFIDFERKLLSIVDGALELSVEKKQSGYETFFTPIRLSDDRHNLKPVSYVIEDGKLLVRPQMQTPESALARVRQLIMSGEEVKVVLTGKQAGKISLSHYFLLREVSGWSLGWIAEAFWDELDDVLKSLGILYDSGVIKFVTIPVERSFLAEKVGNYGQKLAVVFTAGFEELAETVTGYLNHDKDKDLKLGYTLSYLRQLYARLYAYARASIESTSFDTLLAKMLREQLGLKADVKKKSSKIFVVEVKSCPVCGELDTIEDPQHCQEAFSPMLSGAARAVLKTGVEVSELECSGKGGKKCVFVVKVLS